jgi:hypothetical protein
MDEAIYDIVGAIAKQYTAKPIHFRLLAIYYLKEYFSKVFQLKSHLRHLTRSLN